MKKGFSLVEILLYLGLFSIFVGVLSNIFISSLDIKLESEATSAVEQDARYLINRFAYDVARADEITTPASLGEKTNQLGLEIGGATYSYTLADADLVLTNDLGASHLNSDATSVSTLSFQKIGNPDGKPTVQIILSLTSETVKSTGQPEVRQFQTTVGIR